MIYDLSVNRNKSKSCSHDRVGQIQKHWHKIIIDGDDTLANDNTDKLKPEQFIENEAQTEQVAYNCEGRQPEELSKDKKWFSFAILNFLGYQQTLPFNGPMITLHNELSSIGIQ